MPFPSQDVCWMHGFRSDAGACVCYNHKRMGIDRMYFYQNLYVSNKIEHPGKVKWRLRHQAGQFSVYLLLLCSAESKNQLEIINSAFLQQPFYKKKRPLILGMAAGRSDAMDMAVGLIEDAYAHTGTGDVRSYLFPEGVVIKGNTFWAYREAKEKQDTSEKDENNPADKQERG